MRILTIFFFIFLSACELLPTPENGAKKAVRDRLIDPDSGKFELVITGTNPENYCGLVNGKNRFGAYTGAKPFIYEKSVGTVTLLDSEIREADFQSYYIGLRHATIEDLAEKDVEIQNKCLFPKKWKEICGTDIGVSDGGEYCKGWLEGVSSKYDFLKSKFGAKSPY